MTSSKVLNGRSHKIRRPKHPRTVDIALRRGFKNNGNIEIENDPTDDEEFGIEREELGMTYRLPEKGIKLDFIDKVRRYMILSITTFLHFAKVPNRGWVDRDPRLDQEIALTALAQVATSLHPYPAHPRSPPRLSAGLNYPYASVALKPKKLAMVASGDPLSAIGNEAFNKAPPNLQEAALSLVQLASSSPEITLSSNAIKNLVGNLIVSCYNVILFFVIRSLLI